MEELISKKELLKITGISYGQLYRWKRERLIPEEWFLKQASYTGQETFFPKDQILARVEAILDAKDTHTLEELAKLFSPEYAAEGITVEEMREIEELLPELLPTVENSPVSERFKLMQVAFFCALSSCIREGKLQIEEASSLIYRCSECIKKLEKNAVCTLFYAGEEVHALFSTQTGSHQFDLGVKSLQTLQLGETGNTLKIKYKDLFCK